MNETHDQLETPRRRDDGLRHVPDAVRRERFRMVGGSGIDDNRADAFKRAFSGTDKAKKEKAYFKALPTEAGQMITKNFWQLL